MISVGLISLGFFLGYFFFWLRMKFKQFLALNYRKIKSTKHFKEIQIKNQIKEVVDDSLDFKFRPNTHDKTIFNCVNKYNEYRLPDSFADDDIIIDIGAHIGSFSYACLTRNAGRVYAYEAFKDNYSLAVKNLSQFKRRAILMQLAVWRSDRHGETLFFNKSTDEQNTGGGNVWAELKGIEVQTVGLDSIISGINKSITLLKLDCEGSEFPILLTSKTLGKVNAICGEYHEMGGQYDSNQIPDHVKVEGYDKFVIDDLAKFLDQQGFEVTYTRSKLPDGSLSNLGLFFAERRF